MANRDHLLRDLILSPRGQLTIPSANADRETRKAIRELTEGDSPRADYAAGMLDLTAHPDDERLDAVTMHNVLAVARNILLTVTTPTREDAIAAHFAPSGFTPEMVRDGVNFLRRDRLATRRDGVVTVNVPAPAKRPSLPNELLAPRNTTAAHATSTSTSANARPNMPVDERMIQPPDQRVDMGARLRAQAESMPSASFEVGDTSTAAAKPTVKEKPAAPTIPDSVLVAFTESVLDMWARHGKPSGKWAELPWDLPTVELSEGITSDDVVHRVFDKLIGNGVVRQDGEIFTYVPAERAVSETVDFLTRFIGHVSFDTHTRADLHRDASGVAAPAGWTTATITDLALAELVADGTLTVDGDVFTRVAKSEPKPVAPAPVETPAPKPEAVAPERKPAGDTMDAPRTRSFSIRLRFDILFAALATLYIVPWSNPVQSLPWWVILLPLAAILALRVLVFYVKRAVTRREQYAADELFVQYKTFDGVRVNLIERNLKVALNEAFASFDPLATKNLDTSPLPAISKDALDLLRNKVGSEVEIIDVSVPTIDYDDKTEERINQINEERANTTRAGQEVETNKKRREAAEELSKMPPPDLRISIANCLNKMAETGTNLNCFPIGQGVVPTLSIPNPAG